jgi:hypothetical protein
MTVKNINVDEIRNKTLLFIKQRKCADHSVGTYEYSNSVSKKTLYSSTYAAMTRSIYLELDMLSDIEKNQWINYLNQHQDDDGMYRDPVIFDQGTIFKGDPLWHGRPHLTCHVITALTCLGGVAPKRFVYMEPYRDVDFLVHWLETRDWGERVGWSGNEIMNVGTLLQYERDFHGNDRSGRAMEMMLEWLYSNNINPKTGIWGSLDISDPIWRSHAVQAAYHWWPLFFYDKYPIPYVEQAIDTLLSTQNPEGGFGWGVHNNAEPWKSSACEDIDSIDPLARMMQISDHRKDDIIAALTKAADRVLQNQMDDGGFVFMLDRPHEYGHPELFGSKNSGAMFPTWFRTLSLALIGRSLNNHPLGKFQWKFINCPGMQF